MALKLIKSKIKATERTSKVTRAMEAVSAVKMRKSQERALSGRAYVEAAMRILERVTHVRDARAHPLFASHSEGKECIIVVTSDKGLAGSLNSAVLKEAHTRIKHISVSDVDVICFGKKSYEYFTKRGYHVPLHHVNVRDDVSLDDMEEVLAHITEGFAKRRYRSVRIVYQMFVSTFEQRAVARQILPLETSSLQEIVHEMIPRQGKFSEVHLETKSVAYTIEPNQETVYTVIFPILIKIMLYHVLIESKASEHSARMIAMKNATDKAKEVARSLTLRFNKERQSIITNEVSEITGGMEALKT